MDVGAPPAIENMRKQTALAGSEENVFRSQVPPLQPDVSCKRTVTTGDIHLDLFTGVPVSHSHALWHTGFRKRELTELTAANSVRELWHTNDRLRGTQ